MTHPTPPAAGELSPTVKRLEWLMAVLWVAAAVAATLQQGGARPNNNFLIFRQASLNLLAGRDLYAAYPAVHFDYYKYSPSFALLFVPFALLPLTPSMLLWNLLNAGALYLAVGTVLTRRAALIARAILFLDMLGSLQNVQSNALVTALMILAFAAYERRHSFRGSLAVTLGTVVKVFPLAAASFAIFHRRTPRVALSLVVSFVVVLLLPLLVTPPATLAMQYRSWGAIESSDALERNYSLMQIVQHLTGLDWPNWPFQLLGVLLLVAPVLVLRERWAEWGFRRLYLCSVLLFCVLFNHQTESPSFVIAVAGVAIWFASLARRDPWAWATFAFVAVCTILASSDAMPVWLQKNLFDRYHFKTVPLILVWGILQVQLWKRGAPTA